jgi:hypothetical protein
VSAACFCRRPGIEPKQLHAVIARILLMVTDLCRRNGVMLFDELRAKDRR